MDHSSPECWERGTLLQDIGGRDPQEEEELLVRAGELLSWSVFPDGLSILVNACFVKNLFIDTRGLGVAIRGGLEITQCSAIEYIVVLTLLRLEAGRGRHRNCTWLPSTIFVSCRILMR